MTDVIEQTINKKGKVNIYPIYEYWADMNKTKLQTNFEAKRFLKNYKMKKLIHYLNSKRKKLNKKYLLFMNLKLQKEISKKFLKG